MKKCYALLLLSIIFWQCDKKESEPKVIEKFVLSDTMLNRIAIDTALMQPVKSELQLIGKVTTDDSKVIEIFPLVGGNVKEVNVELGDYVKRGEVLAVINSSEIADYERQLISAQSHLLTAQKNLNIAEDLFSSRLNSEKDVLSAQNEVSIAEAELYRIKEIFKIYGIGKNSDYVVRAPISGFVIEKNINRDMQLRSDKSDNIFTISEIDQVWILADVYETDIAKIKAGYPAEIQTLSYPDRIFTGKVDKLFNILDKGTKTMKVRIKLENKDFTLKPEMNATVRISYQQSDSMIAIPSSAVIFDKSKNFVMIYKDKYNVSTREVEVYKDLNRTSYIAKGLNKGEAVISKNQLLIYDALND